MKKKNIQPLSEVMSEFLDDHAALRIKLAEHRAVKAWHEVLGEGVSKYTKNVYFNRNTLYVQLSSSVLRAELMMSKEGLIDKINEYAEIEVVRNIVFR